MSEQLIPMAENMSGAGKTEAAGARFIAFKGAARVVWGCLAAYIYRRALRCAESALITLDDRTLRDIGMTRSEITAAVHKVNANFLMLIVP